MRTTCIFFVLLTAFIGCKSADKVQPVSERIANVWTAQSVDENQTTVYTRGGTSSIRPGYAGFRLDLSQTTSVRYTEFDGTTFTGTWTVPTDTRLVLSNLNPQPTGTTGTIEFTINTFDNSQLVLVRTTTSQKTGNSTNRYTLSAP